jgi:hypothetical protein
MVLTAFTLFHVVLSLIGIAAGFVVLYGMLRSKPMSGWTALFLTTTVATSVTGFGFPVDHFMPSHAIGILSLILLGLAIYARYSRRLTGVWRPTYVITAVAAQYLNVFVLIVQSFLKVPALHDLAPTQSEPPFAIAQLAALVAFLVLGTLAVRRFRPALPNTM